MTFREIAIWADGQNERDERNYNDRMRIAWHSARLSRWPLPTKKGEKDTFPALDKFLSKRTKPPERRVSKKEYDRANHDRFASWKAAINRTANKRKPKKKAKT